jgi:hypothetical protein
VAAADGVLVSDSSATYRFDNAGRISPTYAWAGRLAVWDLTADGGLVGVLPSTFGEGMILDPDGTDASPVSRMKVPASFGGYKVLRIAADRSVWLVLGSNSGFDADPATLLFKLNGTVAPLTRVTHPVSQTVDAGTKVTLDTAATGSKVTYQWQRNGADLIGETNATFVLGNAQPTANGGYTVVVRNRSGSLTSRVATLTVTAAADAFAAWAAAAGLSGAAADPAADPDLDGAVDLAEFAYGTSPVKAGETPAFTVSEVNVGGTSYPAMTWTRRKDLGRARIELGVASSVDLADELGSNTLSVTLSVGGLKRVVTRSDAAQAAKTAHYFRFSVRR